MKGSLVFARLGHTRISVHWTFAILITWILLASSGATDALWNLGFVLTIFLCVVLHEGGHAIAAKYFGIRTVEITLLPIGGVATLEKLPTRPAAELIISLAGPLVNFIIAAILFLPVKEMLNHGMTQALIAVNGHNFLVNVFIVNLTMGIFNLIPAFPMDGGRVLRALLSIKLDRLTATRVAARIGQFLAIAAVMISVFTNQYSVSSPSLLLISLFIFYSAQVELRSFAYWSILDGHTAGEVIMKEFAVLAPTDKLSKATEMLLTGSHHNFLVFSEKQPVGTLSRSDLIRSLSESGKDTAVGSVMNKELRTVSFNTPLDKVYEKVMTYPEEPVLVSQNNELSGIIDSDNLLEFIMIHQASTVTRPA